MKILVIGSSGFIGSEIYEYFCINNDVYGANSKNISEYYGSYFDVIINANGNSKKFLANENPHLDFELSVNSTASTIYKIRSNFYIFLSSGDVYGKPINRANSYENISLDKNSISRYGYHKLIAENLVKQSKNWLILRLSGLLGKNISKGPIFDIINNNHLWIHPDSCLQFQNVTSLCKIIDFLLKNKISDEIFNVSSNGVTSLKTVYNRVSSSSEFTDQLEVIHNELNVNKIEKLLPYDLKTSNEEIKVFLRMMGK